MTYYIRWMIRRDLPQVLAIEGRSFEFPWSEHDFLRVQRQGNCIGMVVEKSDKIVGYMVYALNKKHLHIPNFAVHPDHRRAGVGRAMVEKLISKLSYDRRNRIMLEVRETNLDAQLFFKAMGFWCVSVLKDFYEDSDEDAYLFQYRYVGAEVTSVLENMA